jgi:hypothetical protein
MNSPQCHALWLNCPVKRRKCAGCRYDPDRDIMMNQQHRIRAAEGPAGSAPWLKIALWTVLFQIAWFWRDLPPLFAQGALPDTDDFQRLAQIRFWLAGQPWYDVANYRMGPPGGAAMHWSRLYDVPVAALIFFFNLFFANALAERIAAAVWPALLLVPTVFVLLAICRRLDKCVEPLLVVLLTLTCGTALAEFRPGRIDHHGLQILLFSLMLLGLVSTATRWGHLLIGVTMAASISIGLDAILLIALLIVWLGLAWAGGMDRQGRGIGRVALAFVMAGPLLFMANVPPSQWLTPHCDANSIVYLSAMLLTAAGLCLLAALDRRLVTNSPPMTFMLRVATGAAIAAFAVAIILLLFPQCAGGPYGALDTALTERWLNRVAEAGGLSAQLQEHPRLWLAIVANMVVLTAIAVFVTYRKYREAPEYLALLAVLVLTIGASFLQYRALRIGIFASVPFCAAFASISWTWLKRRLAGPLAAVAQTVAVCLMLSPFWVAIAGLLFPASGPSAIAAVADQAAGIEGPKWKKRGFHVFCNRASEFERLTDLPRGIVLSDLSSGPALIVFSGHLAVGGPYHRNGEAITDILDFFSSPADKARRIARKWQADYVAFCDQGLKYVDGANPDLLGVRIFSGREPDWLIRLSPPEERLQLFRVVRN